MNKHQMQQAQDAFKVYDPKKTGLISYEDAKKSLHYIGIEVPVSF